MTITGGLDLWPAEPAIPQADYVESLAAEGVPFERLDAAEVMRRWPQWRLEPDVTALWQRQGGLADPFKGNAAHRRLARANGATLRDRTRVTAAARRRRRRPRGADRCGHVPHRSTGDRRRRLDQPAARGVRTPAAAAGHPRAGDLLRLSGPGGLRAGPVSGLDLDGRPVLLWVPDLRRGRPEGGPGLRRLARRPGPAHVRARRGRVRARRAIPGGPPPGGAGVRPSTPRPACTR